MGRLFWITSATVICAAGIGVKTLPDTGSEPRSVSYQATLPEQSPAATDGYEVGTSGSALATAAFGLSALQPETYNVQIVLDIIEASPLELGEKDRLTAKLMAAEAGHAKLPRVLSDIRVSLAVE